jgi:hypothetical protein
MFVLEPRNFPFIATSNNRPRAERAAGEKHETTE